MLLDIIYKELVLNSCCQKWEKSRKKYEIGLLNQLSCWSMVPTSRTQLLLRCSSVMHRWRTLPTRDQDCKMRKRSTQIRIHDRRPKIVLLWIGTDSSQAAFPALLPLDHPELLGGRSAQRPQKDRRSARSLHGMALAWPQAERSQTDKGIKLQITMRGWY